MAQPPSTNAALQQLLREVRACRICTAHLPLPPRPVLQAGATARILIAGQAPGRKVAASGDIPMDRLDNLLGQVESVHFPARSEVFSQDEPGKRVFVIRRGLIKLVHDNESGVRRTVRLMIHGDALGLEVLVDGRYRHTALAVEDVEACILPTRVLEDLDAHSQCMHRELIGQRLILCTNRSREFDPGS